MPETEPTLDDLILLFGGGFALAGVAVMACALIDAMAFATYDYFFTGDDPGSWPPAAVVGAGIFAVLVSVLVGRWMFNLRRWIGQKSDSRDSEMVRRKRRSFTIGAMCLYLPVSPFLWVFIVAAANTTS